MAEIRNHDGTPALTSRQPPGYPPAPPGYVWRSPDPVCRDKNCPGAGICWALHVPASGARALENDPATLAARQFASDVSRWAKNLHTALIAANQRQAAGGELGERLEVLNEHLRIDHQALRAAYALPAKWLGDAASQQAGELNARGPVDGMQYREAARVLRQCAGELGDALSPPVTKTGTVLSNAAIEKLADEAERGYDPAGPNLVAGVFCSGCGARLGSDGRGLLAHPEPWCEAMLKGGERPVSPHCERHRNCMKACAGCQAALAEFASQYVTEGGGS
jgi:hypothetical protein